MPEDELPEEHKTVVHQNIGDVPGVILEVSPRSVDYHRERDMSHLRDEDALELYQDLGDYLRSQEILSPKFECWSQQAEENIDVWGMQSARSLLLALQEELGELTQATLEHQTEGEPGHRIQEELDNLAPLCIQFQERIDAGVASTPPEDDA